jgi:hypothetical protein
MIQSVFNSFNQRKFLKKVKELIDLYAKLLIGTFSFIGPSFTLLISIFSKAIQDSQERHRIIEENLVRELAQGAGPIQATEHLDYMRQRLREYTTVRRRNRRELRLLNPSRQVRTLFTSLFSSIFLVGVYYFQKSHFVSSQSQMKNGILLALSLIGFFFSLKVLWQIFNTVINARGEQLVSQATALRHAP